MKFGNFEPGTLGQLVNRISPLKEIPTRNHSDFFYIYPDTGKMKLKDQSWIYISLIILLLLIILSYVVIRQMGKNG